MSAEGTTQGGHGKMAAFHTQLFPAEGVSAIQIEGIVLICPIPPCLSLHTHLFIFISFWIKNVSRFFLTSLSKKYMNCHRFTQSAGIY